MSNMKNGFSTLNRWLGKRKKDKDAPNGKLSKSSTNLSLSISSTNINETSQLEYNRITPLPAATSNAPFEQTFRITVLLPKDQLYVTRLGARVPLSKLLELVCDHKLLDADKYEFRNPVDASQIYSCDLSIGAVGLSEVRLCHKSESYDNFNADEIIKLHRNPIRRDSQSSSEFSSRNSTKQTTKTASPYSSNNSLNSIESTGTDYARTPVTPPAALNTMVSPKLTAPPRKKRAAPRPPSQVVIPEQSVLVISSEETEQEILALKEAKVNTRKEYSASTPNLSNIHVHSDCNGNAEVEQHGEEFKTNEQDMKHNEVEENLNGTSTEQSQKPPEPSPRKRLLQLKKKAAPAPPPRGSLYLEDNISMTSNTATPPNTPATLTATMSVDYNSNFSMTHDLNATVHNTEEYPSKDLTPTPQTRETTTASKQLLSSTPTAPDIGSQIATDESLVTDTTPAKMPKPVPRSTTTTLLNATSDVGLMNSTGLNAATTQTHGNVSKVVLNRTPEPRSLSTEPPDVDSGLVSHADGELANGTVCEDDDNASKQADSGIGEPTPSPIPDSLPSEGSAHEFKSHFESSSDDDDQVKVYNFKLGKTVVKPVDEQDAVKELSVAAESESDRNTPVTLALESITESETQISSWNISIPISPPPHFADAAKFTEPVLEETLPDTPITPKINERPMLDFEILAINTTAEIQPKDMETHTEVKGEPKAEEEKLLKQQTEKLPKVEKLRSSPLPSPTTPMNEIVDELVAILHDNRMDSLIRKAEEQSEIEAAKPNTLSNFTIAAITQQTKRPLEIFADSHTTGGETNPVCEGVQHHSERSSSMGESILFNGDRQSFVTRSESFHNDFGNTTMKPASRHNGKGLNARSSSQVSLTKLDQNRQSDQSLNGRRSSSELSIGECPSLQSVEVMKTILNSRKNSLANSSDGSESKIKMISHVEDIRISNDKETKLVKIELKPNTEEIDGVEKSSGSVENCEIEIRRKNEEFVEPQPKESTKSLLQIVPSAPKITANTELEDTPKVEEAEATTKDLPKIYRYSGPPSINFSTWNERPKVQVVIKNEGDYIFGGKTAENMNSMPTNYQSSTPSNGHQTSGGSFSMDNGVLPPAVPPKPNSPTKRMGIPEQEFFVPITVRPLKDVTVENVGENRKGCGKNKAAIIQSDIESNTKVSNEFKSQLKVSRPLGKNLNSSTLPRSGVASNRFSMPATNFNQTDAKYSTYSSFESQTIKPKPAAKETQINAESVPFGQNTLRKTGLKEKILALDEAAQKVQDEDPRTLVQNNLNTTKTICTGNSNAHSQTTAYHGFSAKSPNSTNLKLTLKSIRSQSETGQLSSTPLTPTQHTRTPQTAPAAPPAPPAPFFSREMSSSSNNTLRSKSANNRASATPSGDERDQLLEAIRSFRKEQLNRT